MIFIEDFSCNTSFPFLPGEYRVKHTDNEWELAACHALRREVFCEEQHVFEEDDHDAIDDNAIAIAVLSCVAGIPDQVVGTVRIHQAEPGLWYGSRLAVHHDYRRAGWLGKHLILHAVCTAHARGCTRFLATVQRQNVRLFKRLHWEEIDSIEVQGRPHALMQAELAHYPPRPQNEVRYYSSVHAVA
jgi:putative N-acetyltransferase (TIGR04045 family)